MFKLKGLFLLSLVGFLVLCNSLSFAQANPELNLQNSGSMGFVPAHSRPITSNRTNDLKDSGVTLSEERKLSALGCGVLDTHELRKSILDTPDATMNEYFGTNVSNYMVTTLFNSPAVAEIFNGLENFTSSRVREMQDRCAAMEYKDDMAAVQWAAVQQCVLANAQALGGFTPENYAKAFQTCLSKSEDAGAPVTDLVSEGEAILQSEKWNGTLFSALEHTRICMQTTSGRDCSLLALLPNVRWCTQSNKHDFEYCDDGSGASASAEFNISAESLSPIQIYDASFGITEGFIDYANSYATRLIKLVGLNSARRMATEGANRTGAFILKSVDREVIEDGTATGMDFTNAVNYGVGEQPTPQFLEDALKNFLNCSAKADTLGAPEWDNFNDVVDDGSGSPEIADLISKLPDASLLIVGVDSGDRLNAAFRTAGAGGHSNVSDVNVSDIEKDKIYDLLEMSAICTVRNELRLTLADYINLKTKNYADNSMDAALLGYRAQVAYASTRNILRFLIHRLKLAQLDLSMIVSTDPNSPPPYVRSALETVIDSIENRLAEMEERRKQQRDYAKMIAAFHGEGS